MTTAYLGPEGSYSHVAALEMTPEAELLACGNFSKVFASVVAGGADCAVVPIENTLNGDIAQNIDFLQSFDGLFAFKEHAVKIDHRLFVRNGADVKKIKRVFSHAQAIEQCSRFLYKNLPEAKLIAVPSTAAGLEMITCDGDAGIAGAHMRAAGLTSSDCNIADESENYTYFLLIKRGCADEKIPSRRIYFSAVCDNRAGALLSLLRPVYENGLNMTKIHSRPIKDRRDEYRFFIEAEADYSDANVRRALEEVKSGAKSFRILGCY